MIDSFSTSFITQQQLLDGQVFVIDKPLEWTSFDVIGKLRKIFKIKKIGHAGTLDPLATGVLIVCTGKFTKKINEYMGMEKEYTGTITLGYATPTFDLESEPVPVGSVDGISLETAQAVANTFTGVIQQIPPAHSAIKIDGKRVYELARQGKEVKLEPRTVTVNAFELTNWQPPVLSFRVVCSTGTYIRSLANDLGASLGCGGYLSSLCRTRIGAFHIQQALQITDVEARFDKDSIQPKNK
jgi:tRNA pseudouridine55 synthase